jgi:hypothetical protein
VISISFLVAKAKDDFLFSSTLDILLRYVYIIIKLYLMNSKLPSLKAQLNPAHQQQHNSPHKFQQHPSYIKVQSGASAMGSPNMQNLFQKNFRTVR